MDWQTRVAEAVGLVDADAIRPLGGTAWLVEAADRRYVVKVGPGALDEAAGLAALGGVEGGPPVPAVIVAEAELLVTVAVEQAPRTRAHDESLGHALAVLHDEPYPHWGGGSSWIGACRVDPASADSAADFYGRRLGELARRCGLGPVVDRVVARLGELVPPGGPALVHGDLWWGNVLFGADDRSWLIDPSVHGGHPEEDLAMLALFGPVPDRLLGAYDAVRPLQSGWRDRVPLFQLYPLLVHAVLFGGAYRGQAEAIARRFS